MDESYCSPAVEEPAALVGIKIEELEKQEELESGDDMTKEEVTGGEMAPEDDDDDVTDTKLNRLVCLVGIVR